MTGLADLKQVLFLCYILPVKYMPRVGIRGTEFLLEEELFD